MTEAKIMKALECCYNAQCSKCPYEIRCIKLMTKDALDLINRKNAEIERLDKLTIEQRREIDRLYDYIQYTRAEAIKEFAERVESKLSCIPQHHFTLAQVLFDIDKTKKEMGVEL